MRKRMRKALMLLVGMITLVNHLRGQIMEGNVTDAMTGEPLPFVIIAYPASGKGTLTNENGFFRITAQPGDTLLFSFIGYETKSVYVTSGKMDYDVRLIPEENLLEEIVVHSDKGDYWIAELQKCKKAASKTACISKGYMELKSYRDQHQVELIETYFNAFIRGYEVQDMLIKTGRIGLQPYYNNFFVSLESSQALIQQDLFEPGLPFPLHPMQLTAKQIRKAFTLYLDHEYVDIAGHTISVIGYEPLDTAGYYFTGKIWMNTSDHQLIKMTFQCRHAHRHPFLPMFHGDRIDQVSLDITRTFQHEEGKSVFHHTDFTYDIDYVSRVGLPEEDAFRIQTKAILYAYDVGMPFFLPLMSSTRHGLQDYRMISSMPYNSFFWDAHDEYRIQYETNENELFFRDTATITHHTAFSRDDYFKKGFYEHPFIPWSEKRITIRERRVNPDSVPSFMVAVIPEYQFTPDFFLDINTYRDSTDMLSCVQLDPYRTFITTPMNTQWHCFVNMYFDICEIQRRRMVTQLKALAGDTDQIRKVFLQSISDFDNERSDFIREVKEGNQVEAMKDYNRQIMDVLGIDNMALFPYHMNGTTESKE